MEPIVINWYGIVGATAAAFVLAYLWFGPLFGRLLSSEAGLDEEARKQADQAKIYGYSGAFQFVMAYCLAMFFAFSGSGVTLITGALYGFLFGFGWIAMAVGVVALHELRSWRYVWLVGGYWTLALTLMGAIIGAVN